MNTFPAFVGLRYGFGGSRNQLVSFLSRLSMIGLILGVALLITVLSVMNGFDREMRNRILALVPQVTVVPWSAEESWPSLAEQVAQLPGVRATAPYLQVNAMLIKGQNVVPATGFGVDPEREKQVSIIEQYVDIDLLTDSAGGAVPVILGSALADKLGITAGDSFTMALPREGASASRVRFERLQLLATFNTGTELDQHTMLLSLDEARALASETSVGVRLSLDDIFAAPRIAWELRNGLDRYYYVRDWTQQLGNMYQAIQLSRRLIAIMLLAVVAVAVFNVVSTLVMVVNDKQGDVAILRSQGAEPGHILRIFLVYGAAIGVVGAGLGALLGVGLSLCVTDLVAAIESVFDIQFLKSDVYPISYLPADLRAGDVWLVAGVSYAMSVLATLYPAWRASRVQPAEALRYR